MASVAEFLTRTRGARDGSGRLHWTDWASYTYLMLGVVLMFGPVVWLVLSSFKTEADLQRYPPTFLPYQQQTLAVEGYDEPLPLFEMTGGEYEGMILAQLRRVGLQAQMVDPANPTERLRVSIEDYERVESVTLAWENYTGLFERFNFLLYFWNSTFITVMATLIMLL